MSSSGRTMSETQEQISLIKWSQQPSVRQQYPELKFLFHVPNERADKVEAANLKRMGVKSGIPDLMLPVPSGEYHGLFIEMKKIGGRASADQLWWLEHLKANGYACAVCYGWQQASEVLLWYLNLE